MRLGRQPGRSTAGQRPLSHCPCPAPTLPTPAPAPVASRCFTRLFGLASRAARFHGEAGASRRPAVRRRRRGKRRRGEACLRERPPRSANSPPPSRRPLSPSDRPCNQDRRDKVGALAALLLLLLLLFGQHPRLPLSPPPAYLCGSGPLPHTWTSCGTGTWRKCRFLAAVECARSAPLAPPPPPPGDAARAEDGTPPGDRRPTAVPETQSRERRLLTLSAISTLPWPAPGDNGVHTLIHSGFLRLRRLLSLSTAPPSPHPSPLSPSLCSVLRKRV